VDPQRLPFRGIRYVNGVVQFDTENSGWELDSSNYTLKKVDRAPRPPAQRRDDFIQDLWPPSSEPLASPDGKWTARNRWPERCHQAIGRNEPPHDRRNEGCLLCALALDDRFDEANRVRVPPGDRKKVYLIQNSPPTWGPAQLRTRVYDRPGDAVDTFDIVTVDPSTKTEYKGAERIDYGDPPSFATDEGWRALHLREDGSRLRSVASFVARSRDGPNHRTR